MISQHKDRGLTVRPPTELRDAAQAALRKRGWDTTTWVAACMRRFIADPDADLADLEKHKQPKPYGRPRKDAP